MIISEQEKLRIKTLHEISNVGTSLNEFYDNLGFASRVNEYDEDVTEGNEYTDSRCKAGCSGGDGTPIEGTDDVVTSWSDEDKKNCGCSQVNETVTTGLNVSPEADYMGTAYDMGEYDMAEYDMGEEINIDEMFEKFEADMGGLDEDMDVDAMMADIEEQLETR